MPELPFLSKREERIRPVVAPTREWTPEGAVPVQAETPREGRRPTPEQKAEYRRLGAGETREGRAYRRQVMEMIEPKEWTPEGAIEIPPEVGEAENLALRFGKQLWNTAVATPAHVLSKGGDPSEIAAWQAQQKRKVKRKTAGERPLRSELLDDEFEDIVRQIRSYPPGARDDDDLQEIPQYERPREVPAMAAEVAPAETIPEKLVDVGAGLAGFIAQLAVVRRILPFGTPTPVIWETANIAAGGRPGQGAAMATTLGLTAQIPAGVGGKLALQSTLFGGLEAMGGGEPEDIAISALIPPALAGIQALKAKPWKPKVPTYVPAEKIPPQPPRGKIRVGAERIYQSIFNRFASIENITKRAQKLGLNLKPGDDPKFRARAYLGMGRKAESILEDKTYRIKSDGTIEITGEGLKPIMDDFVKYKLLSTVKGKLKKTRVKTAERELNRYLKAKRTIEDLQRPKYEGSAEYIATPEQVNKAKMDLTVLQNKYGNKKMMYFRHTARRLYDFQKRVLHTLVDSGTLSEQQYRNIIRRNKHYIPFDRIMDGIEGVPAVPKVKGRFTGARAPIMRIRGSEREIHHPIESIIKNTYRITDRAERNTVSRTIARLRRIFPEEMETVRKKVRPLKVKPREIRKITKRLRRESRPIIEKTEEITKRTAGGEPVTQAELNKHGQKIHEIIVDALKKRGMSEGEAGNYIRALVARIPEGKKAFTGETIEKTVKELVRQTTETLVQVEPVETTIFRPSPFKPKGNVIEYFVGGRPRYLKVSRNLFDSMAGLNETSASMLVRVFSQPASWLRTGATITPEFMMRNPIRDQISALMQTSYGFFPFVDSTKAVADILGKTDVYYDWLRSGGAYAGFVELSRKQVQQAYKGLMGRKKLLKKLNIIHTAQDLSILGEQATRLAVYKKAIKAGKTPVEAGYESREATVDFGRRGSETRNINKLLAFFNAGLQGVDKTVRQMGTAPIPTTAKGLTYITIPQLLLYLRNRNDPGYKEIPRWRKDLFYTTKVPGTNVYVSIPKNFLYGQLFGSIPERFFEYLDTKDPEAFDQLAKSTIDALLPTAGDPASGLLATALRPIIENMQNYQFFTKRKIVPQGIEDLDEAEQYTRYTTETAKQVGKILNYSPAKIENFLRGWFGGSARYGLGASDLLINKIRQAAGEEVPEKLKDWTRLPLVKGFAVRTPMETGRAESIDKFYRNLKMLQSFDRTHTKYLREGKQDKAAKLRREHPEFREAKTFASRAATMSEYRKKMYKIYDSKTMSDEVKKRKIADIQRRRVLLAQKTNKLLK